MILAAEEAWHYAGIIAFPTWLVVLVLAAIVGAVVRVWKMTRRKGPPPLRRP
jgi:hypothetical protein